jgi:FKBP-type peptidyl-prolyl cis-trans isomerase FkpA
MKSIYSAYLGVFVALFLISAVGIAADEPKSDRENMFYYLGTALSQNLAPLGLKKDELELVFQGVREALAGDAPEMDDKVYGAMLNELAQERMKSGAAEEILAGQAYIEEMAKEDGAIQTESGIVIVELAEGTGKSPSAESTVKAHYHGTLRDGSVFDSSVDRGQPLTISLANVIPCWQEGMPMMKEGGKSKITCPSDMAYGDRASGPIPGGSALTFEVELIEVVN